MAANIETSKSKRRSLDADVNLVPFIDFLSVCICFLLMTAVYVQVSQLDVKQSFGTAGAATTVLPKEWELSFKSNSVVQLVAKKGGKKVKSFEVSLNQSSKDIIEKLKAMKDDFQPESATVTTSSKITHGQFVELLDLLRGVGINQLGVNHGV